MIPIELLRYKCNVTRFLFLAHQYTIIIRLGTTDTRKEGDD